MKRILARAGAIVLLLTLSTMGHVPKGGVELGVAEGRRVQIISWIESSGEVCRWVCISPYVCCCSHDCTPE